MTRTIKASEVKPGMTIRWEQGGITYECTVSTVGPAMLGVTVMAWRSASTIYEDTEVTVLSEPAPAQPEEPTEFGAKVRVHDWRYVRLKAVGVRNHVWFEAGTGCHRTWDDLCEKGPVTVIPDQGWTIPDTPEVPDRIEEWPEDDTALRPYPWRDVDGDVWRYGGNSHGDGWISGYLLRLRPFCGPWTRVTDA